MGRFPCWLLTIAVSAAALLPRCLEAAQVKELSLAFSALAYANPPFWTLHELKLFDKHGYDTELIYVSGSRPIQAMMARFMRMSKDDPALQQSQQSLGLLMNQDLAPSVEGIRFVLDF